MAYKQKYQLESEIPYELKKKGLTLFHANKWQKYFVEAINNKIEAAKYYAWLKFRTNYRLRKEGWVRSSGQWSVADKNDFADLLWGVWHMCKRKHFPSEVAWLDNFLAELVKVRNGILERDSDEKDPSPIQLNEIVDNTAIEVEEEVEEEEKRTVAPPPEEILDEELMPPKQPPKQGSMPPPAEEDDGSEEKPIPRTKKPLKRKK